MSIKSRNWCWTLNNYTAVELADLTAIDCRYLCFGKEIGQAGTPHLQGFISFATLKVLPKKLIPRAHFEAMKGTQEQAIAYCEKDGDFQEFGQRPKSQALKGSDEKERWADIRQLAIAGDFVTLGEKYPKESILYDKNLERAYAKRPRDIATMDGEMPHFWFYGAPGTGKSKAARERYPDAYSKNPSKWWDGYLGEDHVILDDFDKYDKALGGDMKRWLDRYPFQAEAKGSQQLIRPKIMIVTSNYHPSEIWDDPITVQAIERRCTIELFGDSAGPFAACFKKPRV